MSFSAVIRLGRAAGLIGLVAASGACAIRPPIAPLDTPVTVADRHRITVAAVDESLELPVAPGSFELNAESRAALADFARAYREGGAGALEISTPTGAGNTLAADAIAEKARELIVAEGLHPLAVTVSRYAAEGQSDAPLMLRFTRTVASVADCPKVWQDNLARTANNQPWAAFGCATATNIAALIDNPNDLVTPQTMTPADAARRQQVIDKYRKGETTHATRSSQERVTVSTVVK